MESENLGSQVLQLRLWGRLLNYRIFPCTEQYLSNIHCKGHRWTIAAIGGGCLPFQVETGRYRLPKTPYHLRSCKLCGSGEVETEYHFVMLCKALDQERSDISLYNVLCDAQKLVYYKQSYSVKFTNTTTDKSKSFIEI